MDEKKIKDVHNVDKSLKKIGTIRRDLMDNLTGLDYDYSNKISGELNNEMLGNLIESIIHRYYSISYHLELLIDEHEKSIHFLNKKDRKSTRLNSSHVAISY